MLCIKCDAEKENFVGWFRINKTVTTVHSLAIRHKNADITSLLQGIKFFYSFSCCCITETYANLLTLKEQHSKIFYFITND